MVGGQADQLPTIPVQDQELVVIPRYQSLANAGVFGYFLENVGRNNAGITRAFYKPTYAHGSPQSISSEFRISQWPAVIHELEATLSKGIERFLNAIKSGIIVIAN